MKGDGYFYEESLFTGFRGMPGMTGRRKFRTPTKGDGYFYEESLFTGFRGMPPVAMPGLTRHPF